MRDSAGAVIGMAPVQLVGVCGTSVCLAPLPPFIDAPSLLFVIEPDLKFAYDSYRTQYIMFVWMVLVLYPSCLVVGRIYISSDCSVSSF